MTPQIRFTPETIFRRRASEWRGLHAETVQATSREPFEYGFRGARHLLIASERCQRDHGETHVEGLPRSTLRDLTHKLTFVPAGYEFRGWGDPRTLAIVNYIYIDPALLAGDDEPGLTEIDLAPRLFFEDDALWQTIFKLKRLIGLGGSVAGYADALATVLAHELAHLQKGPARSWRARGGLAAWQQKRVRDFIEGNLAKDLSIAEMAELVRLSPFHFARAFKRSFGVAPHQFHAQRRIEQAKLLLANPATSVTRAAFEVGFGNTGSFSTSFRRLTGETPSSYRRGLM